MRAYLFMLLIYVVCAREWFWPDTGVFTHEHKNKVLDKRTRPANMQLSAKQVDAILDMLPQDGNMLVWGVGHDSDFWNVQTTGKVVFLEDRPEWMAKITELYPYLKVHKVKYDTSVSEHSRHISQPMDELDISDQLPTSLITKHWDVILVDAPCGSKPECPGRFSSIITSKMLSFDHIFINDVNRKVEYNMMHRVFGPPIKTIENEARGTVLALVK